MIYSVYSIYDCISQQYGMPFYSASDDTAIRAFGSYINSTEHKSIMSDYPQDFSLFYLGTFDDSTGVIEPSSPRFVRAGSSLVVKSDSSESV